MGKKVNGLLPGSLLPTVEFPQIKHMTLKDFTASNPAVLDNTPVEVLLTVLETFFTAQKHDWVIMSGLEENAQGGRSALQAILKPTPSEIAGSKAIKGQK